MGGVYCFEGLRAGGLIPATAADFEAARPPASTWVEVSGRLLRQADIALGESPNPGAPPWTSHYMPVVSDAWRPGRPVAVFLQVSDFGLGAVQPGKPVQGLISVSGLPGPVRARFVEAGLTPAEHYVLVEVGTDPAFERWAGLVILAIGGVVILAGLGLWLWRWRRQGN
jgi:hypothetical protein